MNIKCFFIVATALTIMACGNNGKGRIDQYVSVQVPEEYTGEDSIAYIENTLIQSPSAAKDLIGLVEVHSLE